MVKIKNIIERIIKKYSERPWIDDNSTIGKYTYIGKNTYITKSAIGRYCSIANNVSIGLGEHDLKEISTSTLFYQQDPYDILTQKPCIIKNDVWIGVDSIIRRGVTIGNGAIIGANSFVNRDIPDFAIACGNPARIIRYRFSEKAQKIILESLWWEKDFHEAQKVIQALKQELENGFYR